MARIMPSVFASRELQAVVVSVKALPRDVRRDLSRRTRETMNPVWRDLVSRRAVTEQDRVILAKGARIAAGNPPKAIAASSTRPLSGGLRPADRWSSFAYGTRRPNRRATWRRRSADGTWHDVTGYPERQLPNYRRAGYVIRPAFRELAPRLISLWVQSLMRAVYDAIERR